MDNFTVFFADILQIVANFLWQPATRWITACIILLFIVTVIKRLIKI